MFEIVWDIGWNPSAPLISAYVKDMKILLFSSSQEVPCASANLEYQQQKMKTNRSVQSFYIFLWLIYDFTWGGKRKTPMSTGKRKGTTTNRGSYCHSFSEREHCQFRIDMNQFSLFESCLAPKCNNYSKIWYSKISWWWLVMDSWIFYCRWGSFSSRGWHTAELARPPGVP